ncbi:MAG: hypothetical protein JWO72_641 [Caulobacteraceae bacterium]|nr:hypothetical protein [Caulobacteraceae bacterium]
MKDQRDEAGAANVANHFGERSPMAATGQDTSCRLASRAVIGLAVSVVLAGAVGASLARAQTAEPPPGPLAQPSKDPRDLTGVWQQKGYMIRYPTVTGEPPPYLPWAAADAKRRADAQKAGTPISDSTAQCMPSGVPRIMGAPYPIKILQTNKEVVILHEVQHLFQFVYLNENHPKDLDPTFMGHSVGHWEGNTLVIDTTGLKKETLLNEAGDPHSEKLHIVQRLTKSADGKSIENLMEVDDPGAYSKPFVTRYTYYWRPDIRFLEYICEENNRNVTDAEGIVRVK